MKYDFETVCQRIDASAVDGIGKQPGKNPGKPKEGFDVIPMWVADMNFPVAPSITEELEKRVSHPFYGYFMTDDAYFQAIIKWHEMRYGTEGLKKEYIGYENGVLGGVATALTAFAAPGDTVLIHSPAYIGFTGTMRDNGYQIVTSELKKDASGVYRMDFDDMEQKIIANRVHVAIFCSPHNPSGRVWERWELEQVMELFRKHEVIVISDEIWSDIVFEGHQHIPLQSVSEDARNRTIALYAPSKTFNLAGLIGSYHIIYNKYLRDKIELKSLKTHYNSMNVLSMHALIGAYSACGAEWTDELCGVLRKNVEYACGFIETHFEGVEVSRPEGTYMLFLDCEKWCRNHQISLDELLQAGYDVGVAWQDGRRFYGKTHIRMNLASPFSRIQEAFTRLDKYVFLTDKQS
ncbi:MAG: aminotransferase class I/II-fold pyridoxal phosphate-dependent enzyme [Lachnospiraceae bacterium]|nr:aminotransferase class I/II-fold pyridoxal phosphate-dependent enzyme [Lachnospiraceae bacterium]